ncbi:multi-sensor signal transduction histidine kinase [Paraburkholderia hospita]|uniref:Multi-sensor signal transduction histidine kinase n=1 Tax=Paraburkholderia hospita TaxID=169430 RepID=A0ABN0FMK5_9BURK|nr:response regulator [Paraburkholderia hospita]EIN00016.1 multi-sensor signal transduction histidine kinase [Paraburkholderia hospita]OUL87787.1 response regulator [Paraburkholderia hospita]
MSDLAIPFAHSGVILIVDDAPANLGMIVDSLETGGIRVLVEHGGIEVRECATVSQSDLILFDVRVPRIDGLETCPRLKRGECTREIAVVFTTLHMGNEDGGEGFAVVGVADMAMPLCVEEKMTRVRAHLSPRATHKQLIERNRQLRAQVAVRKETEAALAAARGELERRVEMRTESWRDLSARAEDRGGNYPVPEGRRQLLILRAGTEEAAGRHRTGKVKHSLKETEVSR